MKKNTSLLILILFICSSSVFAQNRESRNVGTFSKINFRIPGKLYLRQGNTPKVEVEASKEMLSIIETEVDGSTLTIHTPRKWNWKNEEKINVYITVKELQGASVSGSGDLIGETRFDVRDAALNVSGSGSMKIQIEASGDVQADVSGSGELQLKGNSRGFKSQVSGSGRVNMEMNVSGDANFGISGSGKIEAKGKASRVNATISGSGRVIASDFEASRCEVRISGSGNVDIHVKDELEANITGSGSVRYSGNPDKVHSSATGSGRVSKM